MRLKNLIRFTSRTVTLVGQWREERRGLADRRFTGGVPGQGRCFGVGPLSAV